MEVEEAISIEDLANRCGFCLQKLDNLKVIEISEEIERKFVDLIQFKLLSKTFSSSICHFCDEKLSDFEAFKIFLQENQKSIEYSISNPLNIQPVNDKISKPPEQVDDESIIEEYLDPEYEEFENTQHNQSHQICPICAKSFSSASLDIHIKRKHTNEYNFYCDKCPQKFKIKRDLISHIQKHTEIEFRRKFQCEYCENSYTKNSSLQHHIKMKHEDLKEQFLCECGASFKTKLRLTYHKKITHEKGEYRCEECDKSYPSMHNLKIHISHFHASKSPCIYCGKLVAPGTFMKRHMRIHEPATHVCQICERAFTVRETMLEHQRTVHQLGETHYCENCGKSFGSKKVLKRHIERSHTTSEKVQCPVEGCSYAANRKDNLINHVKIHKDIDEREKVEIIAGIKSMKNLSW